MVNWANTNMEKGSKMKNPTSTTGLTPILSSLESSCLTLLWPEGCTITPWQQMMPSTNDIVRVNIFSLTPTGNGDEIRICSARKN